MIRNIYTLFKIVLLVVVLMFIYLIVFISTQPSRQWSRGLLCPFKGVSYPGRSR